jgi:hypothetical protein
MVEALGQRLPSSFEEERDMRALVQSTVGRFTTRDEPGSTDTGKSSSESSQERGHQEPEGLNRAAR